MTENRGARRGERAQPMEITFSVGGWEYFEGLLISSWKRLFPRAGWLAFPIMFLIGLAGVLGIGVHSQAITAFALLVLAAAVLLLAGVPALRAVQSARDPQRSAPSTWKIGAGRVEIVTPRGTAKVGWKTFARPVETWSLFLLHSAADPRSVYILPKRAFRDNAERGRFRELLKKTYGKIR
jgi:hypothetical protein